MVPALGESVSPDELRAHLSGRAVKWWLPARWAVVDEVPRNSVGKHEKKLLRERYAEGNLNVMISGTAASQAGGASQPADAPAVEAPSASEPPAGTPLRNRIIWRV